RTHDTLHTRLALPSLLACALYQDTTLAIVSQKLCLAKSCVYKKLCSEHLDYREWIMGTPVQDPNHRPSNDRPLSYAPTYALAIGLAGVAIVTALGFIGHRLGSAPPSGSLPPDVLPASPLDQRTVASGESDAHALRSAVPAMALPAAANAIP